jgi:hypothetical protein
MRGHSTRLAKNCQSFTLKGQGQSVFHNAQELEEFAGAVAEIAESAGHFRAAGQPHDIDCRVAKHEQIFRAIAFFDLAFVFAK